MIGTSATLGGDFAEAQERSIPEPESTPGPIVYLYSVSVNGWSLGLTARFYDEGGRLSLPADQFAGLGFVVDETLVADVGGERRVFLDQVPGLAWQVDSRTQTINLDSPFALLQPNVVRVSPGRQRIESRSDWGALLGYDIYGQWASKKLNEFYSRSLSTNIEARVFGPSFTAYTTAFYSLDQGLDDDRLVRLDSVLDFDMPNHARRLRIGDTFTLGPVWLRTVRFGGIQFGTQFGIRPDIVTTPVPILADDVSVPSTVDLFINGVERFSQNVEPGTIRLTDLPTLGGSNTVRVVVTDQTGRRRELILPLYASSQLLAPGLTDFSVELGAERLNYAVRSNDYGQAFASGSVSHGISDRLTVRAYAAGTGDYWTAAAGATVSVGGWVLVDAAGFFSDGPDGSGWAGYASIEHSRGAFNFYASYQRSDRAYRDLAGRFGYTPFIEQATASAGLTLGRLGRINVSYSMQRTLDRAKRGALGGNYTIDLFRRRLSVGLGGYADVSGGGWGVGLSATLQLGNNATLYATHVWDDDGEHSYASLYGQGFDQRLAWQLDADRGTFDEFSAEADWDGRLVDARLRVARAPDVTGIEFELAQTLLVFDNRLLWTGRIDDGFTIVEVEDSPGVRVALENRTIGRTNSRGRIFVPDLPSYVGSAISIDPLDLPLNASIGDTTALVAPRAGGGLVTQFEVEHSAAALVVLQLSGGHPPPVGARVRMTDSETTAIVGYGGEVYLRGLREGANHLEVEWADGRCEVEFSVDEIAAGLPRLGPYTCAP